MNLEEYTNSSERSLNCWIRWMRPLCYTMSLMYVAGKHFVSSAYWMHSADSAVEW